MRKATGKRRHGVMFVLACFMLAMPALAAAQATPGATPQASPVAQPGPPLYPDVVAQPPDDLYFSTEVLDDGQEHLLLRFSSMVANTGEGPLELHGSTEPGAQEVVSQVVYDAAADGRAVTERPLALDLIFHPRHHHFHLADFARYDLLRVDADGALVPTGEGGKQSSCVLDSTHVDEDGPAERAYVTCEQVRQGLSVGWADVYAASLPDQWVDLGATPLADGDYVLRYTVDPLQQFDEAGRVANNTAETRFTVRDGQIVGREDPPRCALDGADMGAPGTPVTLRCSHFPDDARIEVYWGGWDPWDEETPPDATFRGAGQRDATVTLPVPTVSPGSYIVTAVAYDFETERYVSATVIYAVMPGMATPAASPEASPVAPG